MRRTGRGRASSALPRRSRRREREHGRSCPQRTEMDHTERGDQRRVASFRCFDRTHFSLGDDVSVETTARKNLSARRVHKADTSPRTYYFSRIFGIKAKRFWIHLNSMASCSRRVGRRPYSDFSGCQERAKAPVVRIAI